MGVRPITLRDGSRWRLKIRGREVDFNKLQAGRQDQITDLIQGLHREHEQAKAFYAYSLERFNKKAFSLLVNGKKIAGEREQSWKNLTRIHRFATTKMMKKQSEESSLGERAKPILGDYDRENLPIARDRQILDASDALPEEEHPDLGTSKNEEFCPRTFSSASPKKGMSFKAKVYTGLTLATGALLMAAKFLPFPSNERPPLLEIGDGRKYSTIQPMTTTMPGVNTTFSVCEPQENTSNTSTAIAQPYSPPTWLAFTAGVATTAVTAVAFRAVQLAAMVGRKCPTFW